ncbi:MAG: CerR family C-terminal domain-containing protein [Deltaproteobacteria bacterium]
MSMIPDKAPEGAQKALIDAALDLFGTKGFDATSTRELAGRAGVNVALIAYHFGGKDGLRQAVVGEIARRMTLVAGVPEVPSGLSAEQALARLQMIMRQIVGFLVGAREAEPLVNFMLHELAQGGPMTEVIYQRFVGPKHAELSALWTLASGRAVGSDQVKLSIFAMIGQVIYFRLGREMVTRKMGWSAMGPDEVRQIGELIAENVRLMTQGAK